MLYLRKVKKILISYFLHDFVIFFRATIAMYKCRKNVILYIQTYLHYNITLKVQTCVRLNITHVLQVFFNFNFTNNVQCFFNDYINIYVKKHIIFSIM